MTQKQNLEKILSNMEGYTFGLQSPHCGFDITDLVIAYNGSLDAAKSLHNKMLKNKVWMAQISFNHGLECHQCLLENAETGDEVCGDNMPNPARAWLICIIKALILECEQ